MLVFIGKFVIALIVWFAVVFGLDKWWIKNTDFANGGSEMLWTSFAIGFVVSAIVYVLL